MPDRPLASPRRSLGSPFLLVLLVIACVLAPAGCTCSANPPPSPPHPIVTTCLSRKAKSPAAPSGAPGTVTAKAGTIQGSFAVTSTGEATYTMPLATVPGRAGVEPHLTITYDGTGDGVLGAGFSIAGLSAITRCPQNLAQDGAIREVKYDALDKLCLDGRRLVPVAQTSSTIEFRTFPDTNTKIVANLPQGATTGALALSFEASTPSGLVIEYGGEDSGLPYTSSNSPQAWLATSAHDARGNAMTYAYCANEGENYTAEYALDEITYTSFQGSPALPASRSVTFVYASKDPADIRTRYSGGMALTSSMRLEQIQMLGPGDELVRTYAFTYALGPTTNRTLLTQVEACAGDGVCMPPTQFTYTSSAAGFQQLATTIPTPTSTLASPMLLDIDGDGLDDLIVPDTDKSLSTPQNPITDWLVAHNAGASAVPSFFSSPALGLSEDWPMVANPTAPADPTLIQPELGTAIDYNQDGLTDVFLHDVWGVSPNWIVLIAQPDHTFKQLDTGIQRPFPIGKSPPPPTISSAVASVHLADVNGDGVPDLIQCDDHGNTSGTDPSAATWTAHLWQPASGTTPAGFDPTAEIIHPLDGYACNTQLYTADINGDGKVDLVVPAGESIGGTAMLPPSTYAAVTRMEDGTWGSWDTLLPFLQPGGSMLFVDVNGDGLPDAVQSGWMDHVLRTYFNTGPTFAAVPLNALPQDPLGELLQDEFFTLATPLDYNGDGRQDLLMPLPSGTNAAPAWMILQAQEPGSNGPVFTLVNPNIPFEPLLEGDSITLADPHGPRVGDFNGDGAPDVILPLAGVFNVFQNLAPDQDLLTTVSDGMNAHDPTDPGFLPNVSITYGHMVDASITNSTPAGSTALESDTYLSHADPTNGCTYPIACAVGSRRQVTAYVTNNGADSPRHFGVRYRDGRYHRLGRGFLGFDERIVTDQDTFAGTADFYDNATEQTLGSVVTFPFAGQVAREWRWLPGFPSQPNPAQIELAFADVTPSVVPTNGNATYLMLTQTRRVRREEGTYPNGTAPTVEAYVQQIEASNAATMLLDTTSTVESFDPFGNALTEDTSTVGVDLTLQVTRTFLNDTSQWILGQLQTQTECSTAAGLSQCRTLTRQTTVFGETQSKSTSTSDGLLDTQLTITYNRDQYGNIVQTTASDAFGHTRVSNATYEPEGVYPTTQTNAAMQTTTTTFDARFGTLAELTDPNMLVTTRAYDGFGRLGLETRPDGSQTTVALSRTKDGGPNQNAWRVTQETTTTGGADDTVEYDSLGRSVRWWWHGPEPTSRARVMQEVAYDALGEHVVRRSVPVSETTPEDQLLNDLYQYDAMGREVFHTLPWNAVVSTIYDGLTVSVTDALTNTTTAQQDPLGRAVGTTDAMQGTTAYSYGPFGALYTATTPGGALTRTTRDAFGRVRQLDDPDRGTTTSTNDGFGEVVTSTDALGRTVTYQYDALGRTTSRLDQNGAESLTTTWTWDTAPHGIGKLATLTSPDGAKTYSYTALGQLQTFTLAVNGESDTLQATLGYDTTGRVATITYPTPAGATPFELAQDYDPYGHVLTVRDSTTSFPYWRLTDVDSAGRYKTETFGNGASSTRTYYPDKQRPESIVTQSGTTTVQNLSYDYDVRRDLTNRTDMLQSQTERFRYDALRRLTCSYFSAVENDTAPCALTYGYDPSGNGNLTSKSDVGTLTYTDPNHPHAVTAAGSNTFGYDAIGNQTSRPGATLTYTPFDLPKTITQASGTVTLDYDGDEQRIRKTSPTTETLYFADLYERVTTTAPAAVAHKYYVHSGERVVAVVTQGAQPGTAYIHVDHLGSVDVLTDANGAVAERRSYDAFGQRRNPAWTQPPPASFPALTDVGFTGQEDDSELGLVNMRGRMYDPKVGRFLTTDPLVGAPLSAQSWNPYSYVLNNPLNHVDPTGFDPGDVVGEDGVVFGKIPEEKVTPGPGFQMARYLAGVGPPPPSVPPKAAEGPPAAAESGAGAKPVDVSTTGGGCAWPPPKPPAVEAQQPPDAAPLKFLPPGRLPPGIYAEDLPGYTWWPGRRGANGEPIQEDPFASDPPEVKKLYKLLTEDCPICGKVVEGIQVAGVFAHLGPAVVDAAKSTLNGGVVQGPAATLDLALKVQGRVPLRHQSVTVLETAEGPTLVAGGATDLTAAQKAAARALGLTLVPDLPGYHAEQTAIDGAAKLGLTPTNGVVTNEVCHDRCGVLIKDIGGWYTGKNYGF